MDQLMRFSFPGLERVQCVFSTRMGGLSTGPYARNNISFEVGDDLSAVSENRRRIMHALGFSFWQELEQVHSIDMVSDPRPAGPDERPRLTGDGLTTALLGQALVVKTADCQPILLAHFGGRHIAALHCGWRGNRAGFPGQGVMRFCAHYGLDPGEVMAVRGPSLSPAKSEFVNFKGEWSPEFADYFDPKSRTMDLWRLTFDQLRAAGLKAEHIFSIDLCTYAREDLFFSYRRDNLCGRQGSFIWMEK